MFYIAELEEKINNFIKNKELVDIKFASLNNGTNKALVIYEDK